ncbi:MAG: UDP-diphosphatase [Candidatus Marinimicrobia bacterium]|nr:UDP-diphosphatase [Candidatus Neomarinimicrobiota bacterium]|tara:strand:- start:1228 stop:1995 length:768 start_codon:yes stop_codon:yes gene_type:complete
MENVFQVIVISIVQGVTEFLPVSSSAHLSLLSNLFGFKDEELLLNISAHVGSFFAVTFYFKKEILQFGKNQKLFFRVIIASLPLFFFGYLIVFYNLVPGLRTYKIIGWTTIIFGVLLFITDKSKASLSINRNFTTKNAVIIGFFQVLALIPGVSRSGIIITASRMLNFKREDAAKISFLMSVPALAGTGIFGLYALIIQSSPIVTLNSFLTICLSFIFSYLSIKYFLIYLKKFNFNLIVGYRIILGLIILSVIYL